MFPVMTRCAQTCMANAACGAPGPKMRRCKVLSLPMRKPSPYSLERSRARQSEATVESIVAEDRQRQNVLEDLEFRPLPTFAVDLPSGSPFSFSTLSAQTPGGCQDLRAQRGRGRQWQCGNSEF